MTALTAGDATAHGEARTEIHVGGRLLIVSSVIDLVGEEDWLYYSYRRELRCDGILIRERGWQRRYPRDAH